VIGFVRQIKLTHVGFLAHVSYRIVSYSDVPTSMHLASSVCDGGRYKTVRTQGAPNGTFSRRYGLIAITTSWLVAAIWAIPLGANPRAAAIDAATQACAVSWRHGAGYAYPAAYLVDGGQLPPDICLRDTCPPPKKNHVPSAPNLTLTGGGRCLHNRQSRECMTFVPTRHLLTITLTIT